MLSSVATSCAPAALRAALELANDAFVFVAPDTLQVLEINAAALRLLKCDRTVVVGAALTALLTQLPANALQALPAGEQGELPLELPSGDLLTVTAQRVESAGSATLVLTLRPGTALPGGDLPTAAQDELTGLPTRAALESQLDRAIAQARQGDYHFAQFFIDVDYFKLANDTLGHLAGDEVLRTVAQRMSSCLRPADLVARFGGDEFVALLGDIHNAEQAQHIAQRIRHQLKLPIEFQGGSVTVSASIGIALSIHTTLEPAALLHAADQAMYEAKQQGRAGHAVFASQR